MLISNDDSKNKPLLAYEVDKPVSGLNHWRLIVNNSPSICPIQTIHAVPGNGEVNFLKQPCTTECPLARIYKDNGLKYETMCGGTIKTIDVVEKEDEKIIKLLPIIPPQ